MQMRLRRDFMLLVAVLLLGLGTASASSITYLLDQTNLAGYPGPYVSVNVNLDSLGTTATVTFTSLTNSGYTYLIGDGGIVALNVAGTFSVFSQATDLVSATPSGNASLTVNSGTGAVDGFGKFNFVLDNHDGFGSALSSLSFTLHNTGTPWSAANQVLVDNPDNYVAASHIFPCLAGDCTGAPATGFAGIDPPEVPEPVPAALIGTGLLFLACAAWRQRHPRAN